jgi:hypothetical protein
MLLLMLLKNDQITGGNILEYQYLDELVFWLKKKKYIPHSAFTV